MESLDGFAERLRSEVEARSGCSVYKKLLKGPQYHLRKHPHREVFAYIHQRKGINCFKIEASEELALRAKVADLADQRVGNGYWGEPSLFWIVPEGNDEGYRKAIRVLSKLCQAR